MYIVRGSPPVCCRFPRESSAQLQRTLATRNWYGGKNDVSATKSRSFYDLIASRKQKSKYLFWRQKLEEKSGFEGIEVSETWTRRYIWAASCRSDARNRATWRRTSATPEASCHTSREYHIICALLCTSSANTAHCTGLFMGLVGRLKSHFRKCTKYKLVLGCWMTKEQNIFIVHLMKNMIFLRFPRYLTSFWTQHARRTF